MGRGPAEGRVDLVVGRGGDDELADRGGVVEDEAVLGVQPADVEGLGAAQPRLLARGEQELQPHRAAVPHQLARRREDRGHCRLVVGAEDALVAVPEDAVLADDLDRRRERNGVQVRTQQDRPRAFRTGNAGEDVPGVRAGLGGAAVLLDLLDAQRAQLGDHRVRHRALPPGRALYLTEANELVEKSLALLGGDAEHYWPALTSGSPSGTRPRARSSAARTNSRNSGCGRSGRELNSGWNCDATKKG